MKTLLLLLLSAVTVLFLVGVLTPPEQFNFSRLLKMAREIATAQQDAAAKQEESASVPTFPSELMRLESQDGRSIRARVLDVNNGVARILREDGVEFELPLERLTAASRSQIQVTPAEGSPPIIAAARSPLPGLTAEGLHQNLEQKGFIAEGAGGDEKGEWTFAMESANVSCFVSAIGKEDELVQILATVTNLGGEDTDEVAREFLTPLVTLPFAGGDPEMAGTWMRENLGDKAERTINGVKFQLFANIPRSRTMRITAKKE